MQTITIQIQLEPDLELNEKQILECRSAMIDAVLKIEKFGFIRYQIYENDKNWEPKL